MSFLQTSSIVLDNSTVTTAPTSSIELDKTTSSIILGRNLNTSPEYITISPNAISDGVNSTTLTNISQLSTALASVELPPNSTTLKIDNALLLSDGTNEALLDINSVNGNLDITTTGYVTLNNLPRCSDVPTNADELVNKAYADSIVSTNATTLTVLDTNSNQTFYPLFSSGVGVGITPRADVTSTALSYNPFSSTLSASNFNGTASNVDVSNDNTNATYFPVFVSGSASGSKNLRMDSLSQSFNYNPSTGSLQCVNFNGTLSGTASDATNASNINITSDNTNGTYYIPFSKTSGSGNKQLFQDDTIGPLTYNPITSTVGASAFQGNLIGSSSNIQVTDTNNDALYYPLFGNAAGVGISARADITNGSLTYNPSSGVLSSNKFVGDLSGNSITSTTATTATNATNVAVTLDSSNATYYPTFVSDTSGNLPIDVNTNLSFNPSTGNLSATSFTGNFNGTFNGSITDATNASNVNVTTDNTNGTYFVPFTKTSGSGNKALFQDDTIGSLSYNPSTSTLVASTFSGNATSATVATNAGTATNANNVAVTTTSTTDASFFPTFVSASSGNNAIRADSDLTYNPFTNTLNVSTVNGTATNANNVFVVDDNTNATYYPLFVSGSTGGNKPVRMDSTSGPLSYNPFSGNLSCTSITSNLSGTATNATNVSISSDNTNGGYYVPFVKLSGSGNRSMFIDDASGPFVYNPELRELRVSRLTPDPTNTSAQLFMIERCVISRIQNFGFSIANATWSGSANTNYAFYCGNDGQNNFNAPSQTTSLNAVSRINFCIDDVKYMNINGNTGRVGNVGIRNTEPDHPLDVTGNIRSSTSVLTPQVGNPAGNLNIQVNSSGAGGSLSITGGTDILSASSGGSSGQHLSITINGTPFKIALLNA